MAVCTVFCLNLFINIFFFFFLSFIFFRIGWIYGTVSTQSSSNSNKSKSSILHNAFLYIRLEGYMKKNLGKESELNGKMGSNCLILLRHIDRKLLYYTALLAARSYVTESFRRASGIIRAGPRQREPRVGDLQPSDLPSDRSPSAFPNHGPDNKKEDQHDQPNE